MIVAAILATIYTRRRRRHAAEVAQLANDAITELKKQVVLAQSDARGLTAAYVIVIQLRDRLMRGVRRHAFWQEVQDAVENDSHVRVRQKEENGEIMRVWEWNGPVDDLAY